jgi:Transposase IS4
VIGSLKGFFRQFLTREMIQLIVSETNKYAVHSGSGFRSNTETAARLVGILLRMGIVHMPRYCMHWLGEQRYIAIADRMS